MDAGAGTLTAVTRDVSPALARCELTHLPRVDIDVARAHAQHQAYCAALTALGCRLIALQAEPDLPDSVFVEDTAVVLDELAVIARPGAASRRPECLSIAIVLSDHRPLVTLEKPATLDGGDVLLVGRTVWVGLSGRSNWSAVGQLRAIVGRHGYEVRPVELEGCLHLKSAVTLVAPDTVLLNPAWVDAQIFSGLDIVNVDPGEPHAANALRVGSGLIYPANFPRTRARLEARGLAVHPVDVSELQKAEGAVTCCSLVFRSTA
ncbi:MAG: dimethylarginine dimethylaminohydrolase family protein [Candidatus Krumholzibacteriia bacterium]